MSLLCIFASEYRISDPTSARRNCMNKIVGELPTSTGPDYISNQVIFSCKLSLDYWNPFYCDASSSVYTEMLITSGFGAFSQILRLNIYQGLKKKTISLVLWDWTLHLILRKKKRHFSGYISHFPCSESESSEERMSQKAKMSFEEPTTS